MSVTSPDLSAPGFNGSVFHFPDFTFGASLRTKGAAAPPVNREESGNAQT